MWVFPWNVFNSNSTGAAFIVNLSSWNSSTGAWVGTTVTAGPLNTAVANFDRVRVNGVESNLTPICSSNTAGAVTGAYFQNEINNTCNTTFNVTTNFIVPLT